MTAVIELDLDLPQDATEHPQAEPAVLPAHVWFPAWARRHPAWGGIAVGVVVSAVAAIAVLTTLVIRWWPPSPPMTTSPTHAFTVHTAGTDQVTTVTRRDDGFVSRGEILGAEPFGMAGIVSVAVTVHGEGASCRITVDDQTADEASVEPGGTAVTCLWVGQ